MTAYTVTLSTSSLEPELTSLQVLVLTGTPSSSPIGIFASSNAALNVTPNTSNGGSLFVGTVALHSSTSASWPYSAFSAATTILQDSADGTGYYYNAIRAASLTPPGGAAVTLGLTATGSETQETIAVAEVKASGTGVVLDASTPAAVPASGSSTLASVTSLTTASFTPPGGALLVLLSSCQTRNSSAQISSSPSLTWTTITNPGASNTTVLLAWAQIPAALAIAYPLQRPVRSAVRVLPQAGRATVTPAYVAPFSPPAVRGHGPYRAKLTTTRWAAFSMPTQ